MEIESQKDSFKLAWCSIDSMITFYDSRKSLVSEPQEGPQLVNGGQP